LSAEVIFLPEIRLKTTGGDCVDAMEAIAPTVKNLPGQRPHRLFAPTPLVVPITQALDNVTSAKCHIVGNISSFLLRI